MKKGKDGRYHSSFRYEGKIYPVAGKTEAEVNRKIGKKLADLEAGKITVRPKTVREYSAEWLNAYHNGDTEYKTVLNNHIVPELGDLYLKDVTEADLQTFLNRKADTFSKSYVSKMKLALCQMFHKARKNRLIPEDPAEDLVIPECKQGKRRSLTDAERDLLLKAIENHRGRMFIMCMLYCGLRPQEAAVLQWKDIDMQSGLIHITHARKRKTGRDGAPKSEAGERYIPIPEALKTQLNASDPLDYVCAWDHKPIDQKKEARMWANIKREMDILAGAKLGWAKRHEASQPIAAAYIVESKLAPDLDLYCLRHTYCTDLQKAGVPINIARELMGHSSIGITAQIYTHTGTEEAKKSVALLDAFHSPRNTKCNTEQKENAVLY